MFGLSTSWKSDHCKSGEALLQLIEATGIRWLELEYRITLEMFQQMKEALRNGFFSVLSIHNYFPHPEILPIERASGDAFYLSSPDLEERKLAIKYSTRSIQLAHELGARAVVFHLGKVDVENEAEKWFNLFDSEKLKTPEGKKFVNSQLKLRQTKSDKNLDAVFFSLEELNSVAIKLNVMIGIENRYYWNNIPSFEEIGIILQEFEGGNIGYWHDCGHAQTSENFGMATHEQFLQHYGDQLVGIHLHDCNGYQDHIAPGKGEIDFTMIKKYLPENSIKILEVHDQVTLTELKAGIDYLENKEIVT